MPEKPIKVERYLRVKFESGAIELSPGSSTYFLLPAKAKEELAKYGFDFRKNRKMIKIDCEVAEESTGGNPFKVKVIFSLAKMRVEE